MTNWQKQKIARPKHAKRISRANKPPLMLQQLASGLPVQQGLNLASRPQSLQSPLAGQVSPELQRLAALRRRRYLAQRINEGV